MKKEKKPSQTTGVAFSIPKHQRYVTHIKHTVKYLSPGAVIRIAYGASKKGSESMLTAKQEAFVQNIIQGMSQADAYRSAYSCKNMTDNAIYREASVLSDNPKVSQRLKELREQLAKPSIMSAQERLEWLTQLINNADEGTTDKLKAIDIMNKMQGEYVQKVEATVDNNVTINVELVDE